MDAHLNNIRNASNPEQLAAQICQLVEANDVYAFAEYLAEPSVKSLENDPNYGKFYKLLQLFAYGTYGDAMKNKNELPELTETMLRKLRQLTLVTLCTRSKIFPIEKAMQELQMTDLETFQRLFINTVYDGVIQGRINALKSEIEVYSWKNRDVNDEELDAICKKLQKWIQHCSEVKEELIRVSQCADQAVAEANERENKVVEEMKKVQKMLDDEEEQRMNKEIYRRSKTQRGKKQS